ncbi:MAG: entericidin A/B family lipoprotein [Gammaproteobacteria bacterium]
MNRDVFKQPMNDLPNLKSRALAIILAVSVLGLYGCNTVEGFGKDLEKLGDKIEKKAEQKKHY